MYPRNAFSHKLTRLVTIFALIMAVSMAIASLALVAYCFSYISDPATGLLYYENDVAPSFTGNGGDFHSILSVPEPSSLSILALNGWILLRRRTARK